MFEINKPKTNLPFHWIFYQRIAIGIIFIMTPLLENIVFSSPVIPLSMIVVSGVLICAGIIILYFPVRYLWQNNFSVVEAGKQMWVVSYKRHHNTQTIIDPDAFYSVYTPVVSRLYAIAIFLIVSVITIVLCLAFFKSVWLIQT